MSTYEDYRAFLGGEQQRLSHGVNSNNDSIYGASCGKGPDGTIAASYYTFEVPGKLCGQEAVVLSVRPDGSADGYRVEPGEPHISLNETELQEELVRALQELYRRT